MNKVLLFTDGACRGNPGPGGWGAVIRKSDHEQLLYAGEKQTTNNRMELMAVIKGLNALDNGAEVLITTDSKYVMDGMRSWIHNWKKRGWKTAAGKPVKNQDLWMLLDEAVAVHKVEWEWVKGHSGHPENELADQLANQAIDEGKYICDK